MAEMQSSSMSDAAVKSVGATVVLPKSDVMAAATSDPLPWLIRNLLEKQRVEKRNCESQTHAQPSAGDANPVG